MLVQRWATIKQERETLEKQKMAILRRKMLVKRWIVTWQQSETIQAIYSKFHTEKEAIIQK